MDRTSVLVECDQWEDRNRSSELVALTRLHHRAQSGECLTDHELTLVRVLMQNLGIVSQKTISTDTGDVFFLSQPLGAYYTKITVPQKILGAGEVQAKWAANPIEIAEVYNVESRDNFRVLMRCKAVSLHFSKSSFAEMLRMLMSVKLGCGTLELRNLKIQTAQIKFIKARLQWPNLKTIIVA